MTESSEWSQRIAGLSEAQVQLLERRLRGARASVSRSGSIARRASSESGPLSIMQERVWLMDQLVPGSPLFNLPAALRISFPIDPSALKCSLDEIVRRHETLRTRFSVVDGTPVQIVQPQLIVDLPIADLSGLPPDEREAEARSLGTEEARLPFDLEHGPLLRARLLRLGLQDHVLIVTVHHIVSDAWSMSLLFRELNVFYGGFVAGRRATLPDLPVQYADYAAWQRTWLTGATLQAELDYWKRRLHGAPGLSLPTDRTRPDAPTFNGGRYTMRLPSGLSASVRQLARCEGVTLFMALLAGFQALLARYTGQEDIVVGSHTANRNRVEIEGLIGFFINTVVLRTDLSGDPTFRDILHRVEEVALNAYAHQDLPYTKIEELLNTERDPSRSPLFQVVFQLLNLPNGEDNAANAGVQPFDVSRGTATFDLVLNMVEEGCEIVGGFEYNTDLFDRDTIVRLGEQYQLLLEGAVADPNRRLSWLPLLRPEERQRILIDWNGRGCDVPPGNIVTWFDRQVAERPDATAFLCHGVSLTYRELADRAACLARTLCLQDVESDTVVGICIQRSLDLPVALIGVLMAGAAFLPLDPAYPRERLIFMLTDAEVRIVVTCRALAPLIDGSGVLPVFLDDSDSTSLTDSEPFPGRETTSIQLAYVLYTSGSTGRPKGVVVPHLQLLNRLAWMWREYPFAPDEIGCQMTAFSFVDSIWELLGPLLQGIPTVIIPPSVVHDPQALVTVLSEHRVSRAWVVPSLLRALFDVIPDIEARLPKLTFWVSSGEVLPPDLVARFRETMPHAQIYNLYGTSEVWDATWHRPGAHDAERIRVSIGKPIDNVRVYVLDRHMQLVPVGVPGELFIGGAGLARGYLGRPNLTEERFITDPFARIPSERVYRTGDLARWRADGSLEYFGRADQQIKLRGYRIEPGEIEALLLRHPRIRQAVVIARADGPCEPHLVAYIVTTREDAGIPDADRGSGSLPEPLESELRRLIEEAFPEYMRPAALVFLGALPLTPSGKIDRLALPSPESVRPRLSKTYLPPRTPTEERLTQVWSDLLGYRNIGIRDHFFNELGGHSLLAIRLVSRIRGAFEIELSLRSLFDTPTIMDLAVLIDGLREWGIPVQPPPLVPINREHHRVSLTGGPDGLPPP